MMENDARARQTHSPLDEVSKLAPKLKELTRETLFADVWERAGLSKRDRSLVTLSALIVQSRPDQLRAHVVRGIANGVTREEMAEVVVHLAFYAGWPAAVSAALIIEEETGEHQKATDTDGHSL
jgi:4-carboxymuconolactone decarboxylase